MKFLVAFLDCKLKNNVKPIDVKEYRKIGNYHCIKNYRYSNLKAKGVPITDGELENASEWVAEKGGEGIAEICYIFINTSTKRVYYRNYSNNQLFVFLNEYFDVKKESILYDVDIEKMKYICDLDITVEEIKQGSIFDVEKQVDEIISDIADRDNIKCTKYRYEYRSDSLIKGKLSEKLKKFSNMSVKIRGLDDNKNEITIGDIVALSVDVDISGSDIQILAKVPMETFINEFEKRDLSEYQR